MKRSIDPSLPLLRCHQSYIVAPLTRHRTTKRHLINLTRCVDRRQLACLEVSTDIAHGAIAVSGRGAVTAGVLGQGHCALETFGHLVRETTGRDGVGGVANHEERMGGFGYPGAREAMEGANAVVSA